MEIEVWKKKRTRKKREAVNVLCECFFSRRSPIATEHTIGRIPRPNRNSVNDTKMYRDEDMVKSFKAKKTAHYDFELDIKYSWC